MKAVAYRAYEKSDGFKLLFEATKLLSEKNFPFDCRNERRIDIGVTPNFNLASSPRRFNVG